MRCITIAIAIAIAIAMSSCGSDSKKAEDTKTSDVTSDIGADGTVLPDVVVDPDVAEPEEVGDGDVNEHNDTPDIAPDIEEGLPPLPTKDPLPTPADPLEGSEVESCALYQEERCVEGKKQQCAIYDTKDESWVTEPDPLLERAYLYDRWRDLYNSPDGQAVDRDFNKEILPLTPESEWGKPEHLEQYWGSGDGGIWTGWSTVASILRYAQTGTEADYQRMEQQVRDMVSMYEVTGIPGYVVRYHFLLLPEGAPNHPDHILRWENSFSPGHHDRLVVNPEELDNMPDIYTEGITDAEGTVWKGTPMWHGRPSIDQNTGPMTSLPLAWSLLKDEELKGKITHNLTCYLKRLQRIELINLQDNPELIEGLLAYFNVGELKFDPEDIDLSKLEKIVGYVHRQVNTKNEETFDMGCPDTVQYEPWRVIDATSDTFFLDMLALISDMDTDDERENQLDHYYFPAIRGGDAMHLMHLATMAYYFTGDEMYREFLYEELIGNIDTIGVMHTAGAFDLPKYCKKYFGDQITFGPWWTFLQLLGESDLRSEVAGAYHTEMWDKLVKQVDNADFNIMYAGELSDEEAPDKEQALASAMEGLQWMGGNGGVLMGSPEDPKWLQDPRRSYTATPEAILAATPDGIVAECATEQELDICTVEIEFMGITLPNLTGWNSWDCTGNEYECEVGEGQCYEMHASAPLPIHLREYTDYLWQRNAFELGKNAGIEGKRQYAGSDYSVPFWNALRYGFITEGKGQVLGWKEDGVCE
jgi:hypothetical protein